MKKYFILLAAGTAAILSACSREGALAPVEGPELVPEAAGTREITVSAYSGDTGLMTKTSRDENGTFYWSPQDEISLFYGEGFNGGWRLTSTNNEPVQITEFTGNVDITIGASFEGAENRLFWGVYPYSEETSCDGTILTTRVPNKQVAAENTFSDGQFVSIGCSEGLSMGFYNLCGGIKFNIERPGVRQITLRGNNGEPLAGLVGVAFDENHHPVVKDFFEDPYTEIILIAPNDGEFMPGTDYFIVTLPVEFQNGFTVEFDDGFIRVVDTPLTINRSRFQWSNYPLDYEGGSYESLEYTLIDDATRRFLEDFEYDSDYSYSNVKQYSGSDEPMPLELDCGAEAAYVQISTSSFFLDAVTYEVTSGNPVQVYNLVPGVKYYYKVYDSNDTILKQGTATPVGPLRWIHGVTRNMRDLGGWKATLYDEYSGEYVTKSIKYGRLYRGRQLESITEDGKAIFLEQLGISVDLDLRGYNNNGNPQSVLPESSCEYYNIKLLQFLGNGDGTTEELYRDAIRLIIDKLSLGQNIYFHCIGGADRTGTLAFLIEALLGVSESDLSKDYELTTYSDQQRLRSSTGTYPFRSMIDYLRNSYSAGTIQESVILWATSGSNPLRESDIDQLRDLLLE